MLTLPDAPTPDVGIKRSAKPKYKEAAYGDGYSQRISLGLNNVLYEVNLTWTNITTAEKNIIEDFINLHSRGQAWLWTLPDKTTPFQWNFVSWDIEYLKYNLYRISASIKQNFDLS